MEDMSHFQFVIHVLPEVLKARPVTAFQVAIQSITIAHRVIIGTEIRVKLVPFHYYRGRMAQAS